VVHKLANNIFPWNDYNRRQSVKDFEVEEISYEKCFALIGRERRKRDLRFNVFQTDLCPKHAVQLLWPSFWIQKSDGFIVDIILGQKGEIKLLRSTLKERNSFRFCSIISLKQAATFEDLDFWRLRKDNISAPP